MPALASLLRYLRACYEEDSREATTWDVLGPRVLHRLAWPDPDALGGPGPRAAVPAREAAPLRKAAALYASERGLELSVLHVTTRRAGVGGRTHAVCAPLLTQPADVQDRPDGFTALVLPADRWRVNDALADLLDPTGALADALADLVLDRALDAVLVYEIAGALRQHVPALDASALAAWPRLVEPDALRAGGDAPAAWPSALVALVPRSVAAHGVLHELEAMAASGASSPPVEALLDGAARAPGEPAPRPAPVPTVLSEAQEAAHAHAAVAALSVVIGPPGTGKSHTLAAVAAEHALRGASVLVAARTEEALAVVADHLEGTLGLPTLVVRAGDAAALRALRERVRRDRQEAREAPPGFGAWRNWRRVRRLLRRTDALERAAAREAAWLARRGDGLPGSLRARWLTWRVRRRPPLWALLGEAERTRDAAFAALRSAARDAQRRTIALLSAHHAAPLDGLDRLTRARASGQRSALAGALDFASLTRAYPVWLVPAADAHRILPLQMGLFDVALVDEATQSDLASLLPLLHRARRAVVFGDPKQLRHLSFLSRARQAALAERFGVPEAADELDYRGASLLDVAEARAGAAVTFLDEHFRSHPALVMFSNAAFYEDRLKLMTARPHAPATPPFTLVPCADGVRDAAGVNRAEVERVVADVERIVAEDAASAAPRSLGVLSPFRAQVDALARALAALTPGAIERHRLRVGTPFAFQGTERDVMLISWALGPDADGGGYLDRPDVFNVAVTRARHAARHYLTPPAAALDPESLLARYLRTTAAAVVPVAGLATSPFARAVQAALEARGCAVRAAFAVGSTTLDLVAVRGAGWCGIDLVGGAGGDAAAMVAPARHRLLRRAGVPLVPVSEARWTADAAACLAAIDAALAEGHR